jgi:Tol biopolymer transport system component/serine/threonine protein kinase
MPLQPGSVLHNRYRIQGQLGKGGMGAVYLAFDETLQTNVAVKQNLNLNPESERQFLREARLLANLRHRNLPRVTDHFVLEGNQYLVMDYIEGEDLHSLTTRRPPSVSEVISWAVAVCDALEYLHSRQPPIIHRDVKPSNLKLQPDGTIVLVDFGIAKQAGQGQTSTGARGLTPGYSPPEQYGGTGTDARSDQYALAATIYRFLTGRDPADSIDRMLRKEQLIPVRSVNPAVPPHVEQALERALAIEQDARFPNIATFRDVLRGAVPASTVAAPRPTAPPTTRAAPRRRGLSPWLGLAAVGGAILLLGGGAGALALVAGLLTNARPTATSVSVAGGVTEPATPTPSPTALPSATAPPTLTPTPRPTHTATPVQPLIGGGGRIAFISDREGGILQVWTMYPDGSDLRQLTFGPGNKAHPRWSPDGERILFVAPSASTGLDLWVINADGTGLANLTEADGDDTDPAWSPDGTRIAFATDRNTGIRQVYLMNVTCDPPPGTCTTSGGHNITDGYAEEYSPAWAPDGTRLAVAASINNALGRILLRTAGDGPPTWFDRSDMIIGADDLAWSPDGLVLAFTWFQRTWNEIYVVSVDNANNRLRLTASLGNRDPAFSPDGVYLAFTSTRDQNPEIYLMAVSGADQVNLTSNPARDQEPDWQRLPGGVGASSRTEP